MALSGPKPEKPVVSGQSYLGSGAEPLPGSHRCSAVARRSRSGGYLEGGTQTRVIEPAPLSEGRPRCARRALGLAPSQAVSTLRVTIPVAFHPPLRKASRPAPAAIRLGSVYFRHATAIALERLIWATWTCASALERGGSRVGVGDRLRRLITSFLAALGRVIRPGARLSVPSVWGDAD